MAYVELHAKTAFSFLRGASLPEDVVTACAQHEVGALAVCERAVKSPAMMAALFDDLPEAVENTSRLTEQLTFGLQDLGYRFPDFAVPAGETMDSYLRAMTYAGAVQRYDALTANATAPASTERILHALGSFALYSFPESHALSFALIAYASAYLKTHRPAEFYVGLLNAQPMGFYSPVTIVQDARRHAITVRPVCVLRSGDGATVEGDMAIRVGLRSVHGLRAAGIASIIAARAERPFASVADFVRRTAMGPKDRHTLSSSGALNRLAGSRRQALWESAKMDLEFDLFAQVQSTDESAQLLTPMSILDRITADFAAIGMTTGDHPMRHIRHQFPELWRADELPLAKNGTRVRIGGSVICRQRPGTAKGFVFISLEDESGVANAVVRPDLFEASRLVITQNPALVIDGVVQSQDGVIHIKAEQIRALRTDDLPVQASHDFH